MPLSLDTYLGIHPAALKLTAQRGEVLAANLANADTPGFKARDIDFRAALAAAGNSHVVSMATTQAGHIAPAVTVSGATEATKYRVPMASALDGNTVDAQVEQANFAQNTIRYQAGLVFLNAKFRSLLTAITGQ